MVYESAYTRVNVQVHMYMLGHMSVISQNNSLSFIAAFHLWLLFAYSGPTQRIDARNSGLQTTRVVVNHCDYC